MVEDLGLSRSNEMYPVFAEPEIERIASFGERRVVAEGETLFRTGDRGIGFVAVLSGLVSLHRHDGIGRSSLLSENSSGTLIGEVNSLSGRPALVDAVVERAGAISVLTPPQARALIVAEPVLGERITRSLILRRVRLIESGAGGPLIIATPDHPDCVALAGFLRRNGLPFTILDPADDKIAADILLTLSAPARLPVVILANGTSLQAPTQEELSHALGLVGEAPADRTYDIAVVGAGPAGLAAAVYAASEGLSVVVLDKHGFGGQAGASARIENYFGFPTGITGQALAARGFIQAQKFGAEVAIPIQVTGLKCGGEGCTHEIQVAGRRSYMARSVLIASGARYRRPALPRLAEFEGSGVWYWASPIEAGLCAQQDIALVGGGNSAGQAAVFLASHATKVLMLIRGQSISATMSKYLVDRIAAHSNIQIMTNCEVTNLRGEKETLEGITWRDRRTGMEFDAPIRNLFLFIGAEPATEWLATCAVKLDVNGFVCTGANSHATDHAGIFAIGDVRSGSIKRVGGAIGEGAAVIAQVHAYLAAHVWN